MEATKISHNLNTNILKNLISSLINKQLGEKLLNLEKKNKSEIIDIKILSKFSKEIINNLSKLSQDTNKKIKNKTYNNNLLNNNYLKSNPSYFIKEKSKKILFNSHFNKNKNLNLRKSCTPLKNYSRNSKFSLQNNSIIKTSTKSLDIVLKKNSNYKTNNYLYKNNSKIINNNLKTKKFNKQITITPKRYKKNNFNRQCKTEERSYKNKSKIFNESYLDNNELDKISINYDEERITNLEIHENEKKALEKEEFFPERISIQLGPLIETIDNEKRIYFLGHNLFEKDIILSKKSLKLKKKHCYNSFLIIIEYIFEYFYLFLDKKSLFNLLVANKDYFKFLLRLIITKIEKKLKGINQTLFDLKQNNKLINLEEDTLKVKPFEYNINSTRALSLLTSMTVDNFFYEQKIDFNNNIINLIFILYFISIGKKHDILILNYDNKLKEKYIINHFQNNNKNKNIGQILDYEIKNIIFTDEVKNALFDYSYNYINIISPNYFQKINKNIALFSFLIKNILEYIGITKELNKNQKQKYQIYTSRLKINNQIIQKLKKIKDLY